MPYERLANVASELKDEIHELRESVEEVDTKRKRSIAAVWGVILTIVFAIVLNIHLNQQNNKLLHLVKDATDPTGQIYQRNLESQADAIKQLVCDNHKLHGDPHPDGLNCP
jgi:cell division protein ZapA (FtsZ GTPase activity inhibitor)